MSPIATEAPRVSVLVPAHNAEKTLPRTLESIAAQSYARWEAIVADDASSDNTWAVAQRFAERYPGRIRAVRRDRNGGPAAARNAALAAAKNTELIALLDADDAWLPHYLEAQVALYDRAVAVGRRAGIVSCNAYLESADGDRLGTYDQIDGWLDPIRYDDMLERPRIFVSALFPRAALDEVGIFSVDCWGTEDYDLWLRILEAGYEVVPNPEPLALYRVDSGSVSGSALRMADSMLAAYRRALARPAATVQQRRAIKRLVRHYKAVRARALVREALSGGHRARAAVLALRALPYALAALLQAPSRWAELGARAVRRRSSGAVGTSR